MANFYQARGDVSVPRVVSKISGEGDDAQYETEGVNYAAGSVIRASDMTPHHRKQAEEGKLDHILHPLSDEDAAQFSPGGGEPEYGIFIAEHEAERHALTNYGHLVIPEEQKLEALSRSAEHHRAYQDAVKEAGYDRRPNVEATQDVATRVPDEVLYGAETPAGTPHDRGPAEPPQGGEVEEDVQPRVATRPRPGAETGSEESDSDTAESEEGSDSSGSQVEES